MKTSFSRRTHAQTTGAGAAAAALGTGKIHAARDYKISLAAWSLHRTIGEGEGKVPMLDMPKMSRQE